MRKSVNSVVAILATAALTLALAGCGGKDSVDKTAGTTTAAVTDKAMPATTDEAAPATTDDAAKASTSDLCAVLDNDTISSITGVDFSKAVPTDDGSGTCSWDLTALGGMSMVSVIDVDSTGSTFDMNRSVAASMFDDVTDVSVPGVDSAFTYMGGWVVAMGFGDHYVQVMYMNMTLDNQATDTGVLLKLAEEVAKNW